MLNIQIRSWDQDKPVKFNSKQIQHGRMKFKRR
jgi:hypothetical protein